MKPKKRNLGNYAAGATVALSMIAATAAAANPAAAASALAVVESAVTCATTAACVTGTNTGAGPGVAGVSSSGAGVSATSTKGVGVLASSSSNVGSKGTSYSSYGVQGASFQNYGVFGTTQSGGSGVAGTTNSPTGDAVYGYTAGGGSGVAGSSYTGPGLSGASTYGIAVYGASSSGSFGVYGTAGTGNGGNGTGVTGYVSGGGVGVAGTTSSGNGVEGDADGGTAVSGYSGSGNGMYAYSTSGVGLYAETYGSRAIIGVNHNGDGSDISGTYIGMIGRAPASGGYPLLLTDAKGNDLFFVDGSGNVSYKGGLNSFARTFGGGMVNSYTPKTAVPTVEDYGTAQLVAGSAAVRLDPTFASSIDLSAGYRVFITPNGDTRGLFVPTKTAAGFIVRESQGGRSTLGFDYRIVATPLGDSGKRMALVAGATLPLAPLQTLATPKRQRPSALNIKP